MEWYKILIFSSSMQLIGGAIVEAESQVHALSQCLDHKFTHGDLSIASPLPKQYVPPENKRYRRLSLEEIADILEGLA